MEAEREPIRDWNFWNAKVIVRVYIGGLYPCWGLCFIISFTFINNSVNGGIPVFWHIPLGIRFKTTKREKV